jgi:hypothetical protein
VNVLWLIQLSICSRLILATTCLVLGQSKIVNEVRQQARSSHDNEGTDLGRQNGYLIALVKVTFVSDTVNAVAGLVPPVQDWSSVLETYCSFSYINLLWR